MTNYLDWVLERLHAYRLTILVPIHIVLITAANQAAFWLRFDGDIPAAQQPFDTELLPLLIAVRFAVFFPMRLHQGVWRYASILDLRNIVIGVSLSSVIFWAVIAGVLEVGAYPRSIFIIDGIILICLMGGLRLARRLHSVSLTRRDGRRVLIYGAGDAGEMIVRDMLHNANLQVWPVGFIDDDGRKVGQRIHGVPVLGSRQELPDILKAYAAEELLIAIPSAPRETLRAIVRVVEQYKIRITTLPRLHNTVGARVEADQIRQLKVEDLLARDPVGLDHEPIHRFLARKRVVVTGAGGSIGSELCRQIAATGAESLMLLERYENSLFHTSNEIAAAFPHVILHTAIADVTDEKRIE